MNKRIVISWNFDLSDHDDVNGLEKELMEIDAKDRILKQIAEGYVQGELIYETDDLYCRGFWSVISEDIVEQEESQKQIIEKQNLLIKELADALTDIKYWNSEMEELYNDAGDRAGMALKKLE